MFSEQEPGPAMVLRVEQMLLTCCSSVSFVSKGKFSSFCLWFADKFDTDTEDWKPDFGPGSTKRCSRCKASWDSSICVLLITLLLLIRQLMENSCFLLLIMAVDDRMLFTFRCRSRRNLRAMLQNTEVSCDTR